MTEPPYYWTDRTGRVWMVTQVGEYSAPSKAEGARAIMVELQFRNGTEERYAVAPQPWQRDETIALAFANAR
jgi:hypothetical protein